MFRVSDKPTIPGFVGELSLGKKNQYKEVGIYVKDYQTVVIPQRKMSCICDTDTGECKCWDPGPPIMA